MKSHFKKRNTEYARKANHCVYALRRTGYYRRPHTFAELRGNCALEYDDDLRELNVRPRGARAYQYLDARSAHAPHRNWGRGWKDYTKHTKQWMGADDPGPVPSKHQQSYRHRYAMLEHL